jgi:PPOX class probable F420-dependent enzyme
MATTIGDVITPGQVKAFTVRETKPGALKDLAPQYKQLLTEPVTASLTTVNNKGEMQVTPVWVGNDGTYLELNSVRGRKKDRNLRSNGKVTLLLMNPKNPYHWMSINGKVVDIVDEDDKARGRLATQSIDSLGLRYVNQTPYPFRDPRGEVRVLYKVEPTQILTFGSP